MQDNATQTVVRGLVKNGQLAFVGGGWSQHDEACPHYVTMIDQVSWLPSLHAIGVGQLLGNRSCAKMLQNTRLQCLRLLHIFAPESSDLRR